MGGSGMQQTLADFNVKSGTIAIDSNGLSQPNSSVDLIARAITINSAVQAKSIDAIAGVNKVDYATNPTTSPRKAAARARSRKWRST